MKLFVIILCLLSERYLIHTMSYRRFAWFEAFLISVRKKLYSQQTVAGTANSALLFIFVVVLPAFLCGLVLYIMSGMLWGLVGLLLHIMVFYYCLGPSNPFYPVEEANSISSVENYFAAVNGQLFAVIFWYMLAGAAGVVFYRLLCLYNQHLYSPQTTDVIDSDASTHLKIVSIDASFTKIAVDALDWIPARITVLLYLLVGNFQKGISFFVAHFFSLPQQNYNLLSQGGLLAVKTNEQGATLPAAEHLVEHAIIVYLVLLAILMMVYNYATF